MSNVVIDGVAYAPVDAPAVAAPDIGAHQPTIGIGITTRNRAAILDTTVSHFMEHWPPNAQLVIVDDASDVKPAWWSHRFEANVGIALAKNKCLELLDGCEHIFLFDDDAYPIADNWWQPYIDSREPHLMRQFLDLAGPRKLGDVTELYRDDEHFALSGPRGVMLYFERRVLDAVGGYDPIYGKFGYEHGDLSNRIHHAGLTTWRYADVVGSGDLIYSLDEHEAVERSFTPSQRAEFVKKNAILHNDRRDANYCAYVEYRTERKAILTAFFTQAKDVQRPGRAAPTADVLDPLIKSTSHEDLVIFNDARLPMARNIETVAHDVRINLYFERWIAWLHYLMDHPEITQVWCVDANDVELLRSPWPDMKRGILYIGHEPHTVGSKWMVDNHRGKRLAKFIADNSRRPLLNPGVVGGDRATMIEFCQAVVSEYFDAETRVFHKKDVVAAGLADMGVVNYVAYERFGDRLEFGPQIVTIFKAYETDNTWSIWKHK